MNSHQEDSPENENEGPSQKNLLGSDSESWTLELSAGSLLELEGFLPTSQDFTTNDLLNLEADRLLPWIPGNPCSPLNQHVRQDVMVGTGAPMIGYNNNANACNNYSQPLSVSGNGLFSNSFDFGPMGAQVEELSQENNQQYVSGVLAPVQPRIVEQKVGGDTPPNSGEDLLRLRENQGEEADAFQIQINRFKSESVSTDEGNGHSSSSSQYGAPTQVDDVEYCLNAAGVNVEVDPNATNSSPEEESQGERIPILTDFEGDFDFWVEATEKGNSKKCLFRKDLNKIFCIDRFGISFMIFFSQDIKDFSNFSLRTMVYHEPESSRLSVLRQCPTCHEEDLNVNDTQAKLMKAKCSQLSAANGNNTQWATLSPSPAKEEEMKIEDIQKHIVRSDCKNAVYMQKRGYHNCVVLPLERPQPGADFILRNYKFRCRNHCQKKNSDVKRWTLVFYLFHGNREVGRKHFNLKVSKCPSRDVKKEGPVGNVELCPRKNVKSKPVIVPSPRRKLSESSIQLEDSDERPTKQRRLSNSPTAAVAVAGTSAGSRGGGRAEGNKKKTVVETDSESFSQDDSQGSKLAAKTMESIRFMKAISKHPDQRGVKGSKDMFRQLRSFNSMKDLLTEFLIPEEPENGSQEKDEEEDADPNQGNGDARS